MMYFEPIRYVWSTISFWHVAIWLGLSVINGWGIISLGSAYGDGLLPWIHVSLGTLSLVWGYMLLAIIVGQIFGEKFTFSEVWPTSAVLGLLLAAGFVSFVLTTSSNRLELSSSVFVFVVFAVFLGLTLNLFLYVMPRMVGLGIIELPKMPWGVGAR